MNIYINLIWILKKSKNRNKNLFLNIMKNGKAIS